MHSKIRNAAAFLKPNFGSTYSVLIIALLIVSGQAVKAALANLVNSLRYE